MNEKTSKVHFIRKAFVLFPKHLKYIIKKSKELDYPNQSQVVRNLINEKIKEENGKSARV